MTPYFDLLIQRLQDEVNGPDEGIVDIARWYNFTTFDIIGDLMYASSFDALRSGSYHFWMRDLLLGMQRIAIARAAEFYPSVLLPLIQLTFRIKKGTWDVNAPRVAHRKYTAIKTRERIAASTDRKDFMAFVSTPVSRDCCTHPRIPDPAQQRQGKWHVGRRNHLDGTSPSCRRNRNLGDIVERSDVLPH